MGEPERWAEAANALGLAPVRTTQPVPRATGTGEERGSMSLWRATFLLAVLGVFTIVFLAGISIIGLKTDPTGERLDQETENGETENGEETTLTIELLPAPGLPF